MTFHDESPKEVFEKCDRCSGTGSFKTGPWFFVDNIRGGSSGFISLDEAKKYVMSESSFWQEIRISYISQGVLI